MKNKYKTITSIFICIMIAGGIMGLLKTFVPGLEHFDYRYIFTKTSTFETAQKPVYAIVYSAIMAMLELVCIIAIIKLNKKTIHFVIGVLSINALGCLVALLLGDLLAIISLVFRVVLIVYFIKVLRILQD